MKIDVIDIKKIDLKESEILVFIMDKTVSQSDIDSFNEKIKQIMPSNVFFFVAENVIKDMIVVNKNVLK